MKANQFKKTILATTVALLLAPVGAIAKPDKVKQFGKNSPFLIDDLPSSKFKSNLKKLNAKKQKKAMNWLHTFSFSQHDLEHMEVDSEGGILYDDSFDMTELTIPTTEAIDLPQAISPDDTFKLHSKPTANKVIYIDVNGHTITGTAWNSSSSTIQARAFDTDGNKSNYSDSELAQIAEIWHRVAEDFAPFDVDVTTEEPSSFNSNTGRILITSNKDESGNDMPYAGAGGVAYVNVWGRSNYASYYSPALVYYNNLSNYVPYIAEAASHEIGHNLGLSHDGNATDSYYRGHGSGFVSWAPIMGVSYYSNVTQWSKGEYTGASQTQDDIAIISNYLSLRVDDHGNDIYTPTHLLLDGQGNISATSPESDPYNQSTDNKGIIESRNDVDYFAFDAGTGALDISVTPAWDSFYRSSRRGANLDVKASLYNWNGDLIASSDPLDETDAQITTNVSAGQYLLAVSGVGNSKTPYSDYGSLGQYFIAGKVEPYSPVSDNTPPTPNPMGGTVAPYNQSRNIISMQANTASDESGGIQYNFICVSGSNCNDSGWQTSNQYTATDLQSGNTYSFQVMARDVYLNTTNPSSILSATTAANNAPQTQDSSVSTQEDNTININLASLSSDIDDDLLSYTIHSQPNHGSITNLNNGTVNYNPASNFNGSDSFNFTVADSFGGTATGTVTILVTAVNDSPIASASAPTTNASLTVNFSSNGSFDPDLNDTLSYSWNFGDGNHSNTENPTHNYALAGTYLVTLTVQDNHGLTDSTSISTTVVDPSTIIPDTPKNLTYSIDKVVSGRGKHRTVTGTVMLNWNTANYATSYKIQQCDIIKSGRGKHKTTRCVFSTIASSTTPYYQIALPSNDVKFRVYAENVNGASPYSNEVTVKP